MTFAIILPLLMSFTASKNSPSVGQAQVLHIALEVLEEFRVNPVTLNQNTDSRAYDALILRLAQNPVVRDDPYTGSRIIEKEVANSYIDWLTRNERNSGEQVLGKRTLLIDFNRMAFFGSVAGSWDIDPERKVYQGGVRASVTARAVLTLAKDEKLYSDNFNIRYLVNSRIMCITGGNHRLLAHKLLGIADFPIQDLVSKEVILCNDLPNEQLNQALLRLESLYSSHDPRENKIMGIDGNEELLVQLAEAYGTDSNSTAFNGLYDFVKEDLAETRRRSFNRPGRSDYYNPTLVSLADYAKAYQHFVGTANQSWLARMVKGRGPVEQLSANQKMIIERLATASRSNNSSIVGQ